MGLTYHHLDDADVRSTMTALWHDEDADLAANWPPGTCYGKQLTDEGREAFRRAAPEALRNHDDSWLLSAMINESFWQPYLLRRGQQVMYDKADAARKLAFGEFNIAYVRGLATVLRDREIEACLVYRADGAYQTRGECSSWEGLEVPVASVLEGHRARYFPPPGNRSAFMVPSGPNCHHSIRALP